ncbi:MAG TPA: hypothetical protein VN181_03100 [Thermoanaerobaculia bacterium]|nr:hypothetical protein [Thermoanaerobaculia bacterium]
MTTLFITCFLVGLALSVLSFVSGFEHITILDNFFHHGHGHIHTHVHLPKGLKGAGKRARASSFNLAAITAFLVWFGGGGLLLQRLTPWSDVIAVAGAGGIGILGASLINRVITALVHRENMAEPITMTGLIAKVTIPIREHDGTGEIVYTHQGTRHVAGARSDSGSAIVKGAEVIVTKYEKGIAYVATWDELSAPSPQSLQEG